MRYAPTNPPPTMVFPLALHYGRRDGYAIRRAGWTGETGEEALRWLVFPGGVWRYVDDDESRVVQAADLTELDFLAEDWTVLGPDCDLGEVGCQCSEINNEWGFPIYDDQESVGLDLRNPNTWLGVVNCGIGEECSCPDTDPEDPVVDPEDPNDPNDPNDPGTPRVLPKPGTQGTSGGGGAGGGRGGDGRGGGGAPRPGGGGGGGAGNGTSRPRRRRRPRKDEAPALTITAVPNHGSCDSSPTLDNRVDGSWLVTVALADDGSGDIYSIKTTFLGKVVDLSNKAVGTQAEFQIDEIWFAESEPVIEASAKLLGKNKESNDSEKVQFPPICSSFSFTSSFSSAPSSGMGTMSSGS